jgi:alkanesulfonate monooxygenase SsuD/methylene tetrahydromethanopterin reductase-like flavin-dependent oxidoreductase (luciferase family)
MTIFGVHVGLQQTSVGELQRLWRRIEELGFGWISVWDHFYGATGKPDDADCLEAVAMHTALACATTKVEVGCLVYCIGYRHPAVLAKAITSIDHLSGGRAAIGLGAGWAEVEYKAYGIPYPTAGTRLDQLEEGVQCVRGLLHDEVTDFDGTWFRCTRHATSRPVQAVADLRAAAAKRTLKIASATPTAGTSVPCPRRSPTRTRCSTPTARTSARPGAIRRAANVGLAFTKPAPATRLAANVVRPECSPAALR